jgi:K+-sensing histidine kinase KdpD
MTTTARLLGHLKWLRDNLRTTPWIEDAVYSAAIRLRAETTKDRTPDAILPKTVRRELRAKVDTLIDTSREASEVASGHLVTPHNNRNYLLLISKKIGTVTGLGARAKLFDGQAVEWREASQPMSLSELMAFVSSPHKDKEAPRIKSSAYQRRVFDAFATMLAASLARTTANTQAEKKLATEALEVGAAMLSEASHGLRLTPADRASHRRVKQIAAQITGKPRSTRKAKK